MKLLIVGVLSRFRSGHLSSCAGGDDKRRFRKVFEGCFGPGIVAVGTCEQAGMVLLVETAIVYRLPSSRRENHLAGQGCGRVQGHFLLHGTFGSRPPASHTQSACNSIGCGREKQHLCGVRCGLAWLSESGFAGFSGIFRMSGVSWRGIGWTGVCKSCTRAL